MPAGGLQNKKSTLDYLGTIGTSDKGDGVSMNNTAKALVQTAQFLIETATDNLEKKGHIASGETAASMKIVNFDLKGTQMSLEVEINDTYKFIDQGVKGTQGGSGKYSFKNNRVSKKMATALLKWARKRGMSGRTKYKAKSVNEQNNKDIRSRVKGADNYKSLAYAIATNIKKKGIPRTLFFSNAVTEAERKAADFIGEGFKIDVLNSLDDLD